MLMRTFKSMMSMNLFLTSVMIYMCTCVHETLIVAWVVERTHSERTAQRAKIKNKMRRRRRKKNWMSYRNKHNLHWYGFSPLCIRRCFVSVELSEKAFLQALHLWRNERREIYLTKYQTNECQVNKKAKWNRFPLK